MFGLTENRIFAEIRTPRALIFFITFFFVFIGAGAGYTVEKNIKSGGSSGYSTVAVVSTAPSPAPTPTPEKEILSSATVIVVDVSNSMKDKIPETDQTRMDAVKNSLNYFVSALQSESARYPNTDHLLGIVIYNNHAMVVNKITKNYPLLRRSIDNIKANGRKNPSEGLIAAIEMLKDYQFSPKLKGKGEKSIILIGDGQVQEGLNRSEIMSNESPIIKSAIENNIRIYTLGYGDPPAASGGSLKKYYGDMLSPGVFDENMLKKLAVNTGGEFFGARQPDDLNNVLIALRHEICGKMIGTFTGKVSASQITYLGEFQVRAGAQEIFLTLTCGGGEADLILKDPEGKVVDANYTGAYLAKNNFIDFVYVKNPVKGKWTILAQGSYSIEDSASCSVVASQRHLYRIGEGEVLLEDEDSSSTTFMILLILVGVVLLTFIIYKRNVKQKNASEGGNGDLPSDENATAWFITEDGTMTLPVNKPYITIGRSDKNDWQLKDSNISGRHAVLYQEGGKIFIEDQESKNGIKVNGDKVKTSPLQYNDRIKIGRYIFILRRKR